jgi:hypothetical protein
VNTDPIRPALQAANDVKGGTAVIYYSGPHSGYSDPTPIQLPESDWDLIKDLPPIYRGEVMASVPFHAAGQYNMAVVKALGKSIE